VQSRPSHDTVRFGSLPSSSFVRNDRDVRARAPRLVVDDTNQSIVSYRTIDRRTRRTTTPDDDDARTSRRTRNLERKKNTHTDRPDERTNLGFRPRASRPSPRKHPIENTRSTRSTRPVRPVRSTRSIRWMISGDPNHHCLHITHTSPKPNVRSRAVAGWMRLDFCDCVLKYYCLPIHKSVFVYTCTRHAICAMCDVRCDGSVAPTRRRSRRERTREETAWGGRRFSFFGFGLGRVPRVDSVRFRPNTSDFDFESSSAHTRVSSASAARRTDGR